MRSMTTVPASTLRTYVGTAMVLGLTVFAGPAMAEIPDTGLTDFTEDIWDFMIENVGLMVIGLAVIGALLGAMVSNPGQGIGRAIVGLAIGSVLGAVPAFAEYVIELSNSGTISI